MRIIWEFDPDAEEDKYKLDLYEKSLDRLCALDEFKNYLRDKVKYGKHSKKTASVYDEIYSEFCRILMERNLTED